MPRLLADVRPLRESADFRRLTLGGLLSQVGGQMTAFAVALQVFTLTGSSAAVGGIGLAAAVPSILVGLLGGPLLDAVDRRRLVLVTSGLATAVSALLAGQAFAGLRSVWLLYGLVAAQYGLAALTGPARRTFLPRLLPPHLIQAATAITMLTMHLGMVGGPSLAGLITAAGGLKVCYLIDAVSFAGALYAVFRLPPMPPLGPRSGIGPAALLEGLGFLRRSRVVLGALLSDLSAMALVMPVALFPAINADRFGGSPTTLGLLTSAVAAGGVAGTALSGPVSRVTRPGRAMLVCGAVWGAAIAGFGLAGGLLPALAFLLVAGVADVLSVVFRSTVVLTATPDAVRGRVGAAEFVVGAGAPQLGNFRAGVLGALTTPGTSAVLGGVSGLAGAALIAVAIPALRAYRLTAEPEPAAEPAAGSGPGSAGGADIEPG